MINLLSFYSFSESLKMNISLFIIAIFIGTTLGDDIENESDNYHDFNEEGIFERAQWSNFEIEVLNEHNKFRTKHRVPQLTLSRSVRKSFY